eukprot:m.15328 g.15328  ORF g.15328 m.15328 type:complete len:567 (+) comp26306_c0_seq1:1470-3170(+)
METPNKSRSPTPMPWCDEQQPEPIIEEFEFTFSGGGRLTKTLRVQVQVPVLGGPGEYCHRLTNHHNLPTYVEEDLKTKLKAFEENVLTAKEDSQCDSALDEIRSSDHLIEERIDEWDELFKEERASYSELAEPTDELAFSEVYHTLIHSPALETLLQLEHSYAMNVEQEVLEKNLAEKKLGEKHAAEMEKAVQNIDSQHSDQDVTRLAARHYEEMELFNVRWQSSLSELQESQRREYRAWVATVREEQLKLDTSGSIGDFLRSSAQMSMGGSGRIAEIDSSGSEPSVHLEESFTIHLGAQLKAEHNLRLLCCNVLDLCRHKTTTVGGAIVAHPQRLQTAMSLYSSSLSGLVLLVDNRINSYSGIKKAFAGVCQQSTDFHFPNLDCQLADIREDLSKVCIPDSASVSGTSTPIEEKPSRGPDTEGPLLSPGNYYVTKHSNLAGVHVVFHLVVDDRVSQSNMSSRHPCLAGLRSILHTASRYDVKTLTVPLLLVHEMTEEITVNWCLRRAELIFKCVKGYMIECAAWAGNESLTLQFLAPPGISDDVFAQFTAMLPNIFRISTPLTLA